MITLKTLKNSTKQEVFDQVVNHLLTQRKQCKTMTFERSDYFELPSGGICAYRNGEGLKCAAGCFIADDEYKESFEGQKWMNLVDRGCVPLEHSRLITDVQYIHDEKNPEDWDEYLKSYAKNYSLEYNY